VEINSAHSWSVTQWYFARLKLKLHCVSKNAPTLASCSWQAWTTFDIFFVESISTLLKMMCMFDFPCPFTFTYFICCQIATTEITRYHVTLCSWNSPRHLAGSTGLHLSRSLCAKQSGWLQNFWTDAGTCVSLQTPVLDISRCDQRLEAAPHCHMGKHVTKRHRRSIWSTEKAITCKHEAKGHQFEHLLN